MIERNEQLEETNKWLIQGGVKQVMAYLFNSMELKGPLSMVYMKALSPLVNIKAYHWATTTLLNMYPRNHARSIILTLEMSLLTLLEPLKVFLIHICRLFLIAMVNLSSFFKDKPRGLNKESANKVLGRKRPFSSSPVKDTAGPSEAPFKKVKTIKKAAVEVLKEIATRPKQIEDIASEDPSPAKASSEGTLPDPEHDADIGLLYDDAAHGFPPSGPSS